MAVGWVETVIVTKAKKLEDLAVQKQRVLDFKDDFARPLFCVAPALRIPRKFMFVKVPRTAANCRICQKRIGDNRVVSSVSDSHRKHISSARSSFTLLCRAYLLS